MEGLELLGYLIENGEGVGVGGCADDEAVVFLGGGAGALVGLPIGFLTFFAAVVGGFAAGAAEDAGFGAGGRRAGGFHGGGLVLGSPCVGQWEWELGSEGCRES